MYLYLRHNKTDFRNHFIKRDQIVFEVLITLCYSLGAFLFLIKLIREVVSAELYMKHNFLVKTHISTLVLGWVFSLFQCE